MNWVEIDLQRGGQRHFEIKRTDHFDFVALVTQATPTGWKHDVFVWGIRDPLPRLPIRLLGSDQAFLDLAACFRTAYDGLAADDEADYQHNPPPPPLRPEDAAWVDALLREKGLRG